VLNDLRRFEELVRIVRAELNDEWPVKCRRPLLALGEVELLVTMIKIRVLREYLRASSANDEGGWRSRDLGVNHGRVNQLCVHA
jgi:hypothetical protein